MAWWLSSNGIGTPQEYGRIRYRLVVLRQRPHRRRAVRHRACESTQSSPIRDANGKSSVCSPPGLIFLTFDNCESHRFDIGQGDTLGHEDAFEELVYYSACKGVSPAWVKNHYALIVWKLAGIAKGLARAGGWREWWTFEKVCEQLKYRCVRLVPLYVTRQGSADAPCSQIRARGPPFAALVHQAHHRARLWLKGTNGPGRHAHHLRGS